jgi:predicted Fe-Mo cluster-binding NifX family protein
MFAPMKIAVSSQNRKTITGHAGKCRKFWVYDTDGEKVLAKNLLELPLEQSFHASHGQPHPLDAIDALICGGMGKGLVSRLEDRGIRGLVTTETDPDNAVAAYLAGRLPLGAPDNHGEDHDHHHAHHHGHHHRAQFIHTASAAIPAFTPKEPT